ncbi:nucleoside triphosphate pyrophosphohydrolase [Pleurocapsa sp. CCALA 161]|uniref:nucleoside triphosphate pyrophosphohydrolase n=1 Tax=Pleurocapsa sp. CCALA 161 TaxID=2107688 RepID=UPI000D0795F5|nr:nucleoside triphosphate pyrophosphohydrolase [Pleurocapsa sp. CCALA 161]PSB11548.1 nucleoside triphosphate pyrophosphohydrolase [Pleurocapsa sp. CCALA 161]
MNSPSMTQQSVLDALKRLIEVVAQLRSPNGGCPWDLAQTPQTLIPYVIEEAYEVVDALQAGNQQAIAEELGDLLLQVVLQTQIASEHQNFTLEDVAQGITAKLIRRHPHVFGDVQVNSAAEVNQNWEEIKAAEKGESPEQANLLSRKLDRYARSLPPLTAGMKISIKAAAAGFEWSDIDGVWSKFTEELGEFQEALTTNDKTHQQEELGDLLFTIINLARWYDLDPFAALQGTNRRFIQRLELMEKFAPRPLTEYDLEKLESLWQQAKTQLKHGTQEQNLT